MGKPEIVEIMRFYSDDENREAIITFGESDMELYKITMEDKKENKRLFLFYPSLQQAEDKAEDFVRYDYVI